MYAINVVDEMTGDKHRLLSENETPLTFNDREAAEIFNESFALQLDVMQYSEVIEMLSE